MTAIATADGIELQLRQLAGADAGARHGADRPRPRRAHRPLRAPRARLNAARLARRRARPARPRPSGGPRGAHAPSRRSAARPGRRHRHRAAAGRPLLLLGHSMGGAGRGALRRRRPGAATRRAGSVRSMRWCCRRRPSTPGMSAVQKAAARAARRRWRRTSRVGNGLQAGMDRRDAGGRAPPTGRPAGARPRHAAARALHRRRRPRRARARRRAGACRRCCCGPAPTAASRRAAAPPSPRRRRRRSCSAQRFARPGARDLQRARARPGIRRARRAGSPALHCLRLIRPWSPHDERTARRCKPTKPPPSPPLPTTPGTSASCRRSPTTSRVPAKSPMFDADWAPHGHIDRVVRDAAAWVESRRLPG